MNVEERFNLISQVGEEIITEDDLRTLLEEKKHPVAYDGMEPSGNLHIAQGLLRAINIQKMLKAGCHFKLWIADWFAWMNNKFGGDLDKIRTAGHYMLEVWKACGLETEGIEILWAKDVMSDDSYWKKVVDIARHSTVSRVKRCTQIMGRESSDSMQASFIFYPCMQCADIFHLEADIAQLGMDQRKVNMLAREMGPKLGFWKPVAVHHHMLMGLQKPPTEGEGIDRKIALKMSKSKPETAIFMTDTDEDVKRKLGNAYCPAKVAEENPVLEYCRFIVFEKYKEMEIKRPEKFGGDLRIATYDELERLFVDGKLHPMDLKNATAIYVNELLEPVRNHFSKGKAAELLQLVKSFEVTR